MGWAQQRPAITGIAFVRVYASDMAASDAFYAKTIGLKGTKSGDIVRYDVSDSQWVEVKPLPSPAPASRLLRRAACPARSQSYVAPLEKSSHTVREDVRINLRKEMPSFEFNKR